MSGHSKWSTIKHKKSLVDAKRGNLFTKMTNAITVAVNNGGGVGDVNTNFSLRLAVEKAKMVNMPKENIQRAIKKGMGKLGSEVMEEILLEAYIVGGIALVIEAMSDKRNRTVSEIKNLLEKQGGELATPGSVLYKFRRVGKVSFEGELNEEESLKLIDCGVSEFEVGKEGGELYCAVDNMADIMKLLKQDSKGEIVGEMVYQPKTKIKVSDHERVIKLLDIIMKHDDVQEVYTNVE